MTDSWATAICAHTATMAKTSVIIAFPQIFIATLLHGSRGRQEKCVNEMEFIFWPPIFCSRRTIFARAWIEDSAAADGLRQLSPLRRGKQRSSRAACRRLRREAGPPGSDAAPQAPGP